MSRDVDESDGSLTRIEVPDDIALSGSFPVSATDIHYAQASRGMAGRFHAYRFSAPLPDLYAHALAEFDSHWEELSPAISRKESAPFDESTVQLRRDAFGVRLDWLDPGRMGGGVRYMDEHGSSRPLIYIDEENDTLYFTMCD